MSLERIGAALGAAVFTFLAALTTASAAEDAAPAAANDTYTMDEIVGEASGFFETGAEAVAVAVAHVFEQYGRPNAFIAGEEGSGAIGVGLRYGQGTLNRKGVAPVTIFWQGPSIGFDFGANASKCFTLIYNLPDENTIYQRFPGVEGSYYFIAGIGVNYQQSDNVVLAPMRTGIGLRAGANIGYLSYTRERRVLPF